MKTPSSAKTRPRVGDIIAYAFLWSDQADAGLEEGLKDRPCVIVVAVGEGDRPDVLVAPITTSQSNDPNHIPLSAGVLGLGRQSWIVPTELNAFRWPGPDLRRAARPAGAWWRFGALGPEVRTLLAKRVRDGLARRKARLVKRS
jgi:hypothetical protein